jgi:excisionase family DNA binding protein
MAACPVLSRSHPDQLGGHVRSHRPAPPRGHAMNARRPTAPLRLEILTPDSPTRRSRPPSPPERPSVEVTLRSDDRLLLSVDEAAQRLSIGRSLLYELLAAGEIHSVQVGRLRRVPASALSDFINRRSQPSNPNTEDSP